ncbi:conserved hypothetical protein [Crocosphaera subtropica ATCC 51142]|uniref:Uncharacterized protein n=1 Tax=Crocosphaera subtropica (strain ATCC 51142 / BH68) TaxID=43989 RepID=B1WSK4_CROS5|nr:DUF6335 family protein [Crocosphaera subtropica]ACB53583.1 conserved hypothetical protein [Crocosphaera subtropica ATCC 51142]
MVQTNNSSQDLSSSNPNEMPDRQITEPSEPNTIPPGVSDRNTGMGATLESDDYRLASGENTTAGDLDAMTEQAKVVGEEAIGGDTPTPDQNNVDDIGDATGVDFAPSEPVEVFEEMQQRDSDRFELDPNSKES